MIEPLAHQGLSHSQFSSPEQAINDIVGKLKSVYRNWGPSTPITQMRLDWDRLFADSSITASYEACTVAQVACAWVAADQPLTDHIVVYLHGGGFKVGSTRSHFELMAGLSSETGCRVLGVDYRLAPEHLFPAALLDVCAVYEDLLRQNILPRNIALAGDSAGGGLVVSTLLALKSRGHALPSSAYLMSPWTDLSASGESYTSHAKFDRLHSRAMLLAMAQGYLGASVDPTQALVSPLFADLQGLPPMLIQVGADEVILSDSTGLAEAARAAQVEVEIEVWEGMIHVFQQFPSELAEAGRALSQGGAFLRRHFNRIGRS
jgi:epsilon-lactone hydrolase